MSTSRNNVHYLSPNPRLPIDVDFEIYTSASSSTPIHVGAHKCFLADASPVFDYMFYTDGKPLEGVAKVNVCVGFIDDGVFRLFLRHLYGEKVVVDQLSISSALEMSALAEKYKIKDLEEEIMNKITSQQVNSGNIFEIVDQLKKLSISSDAKAIMDLNVSAYLYDICGNSLTGLANFLSEREVDGDTVCYLMKVIAEAGWIEDADYIERYLEREMLRRFLIFSTFPEDLVDNVVDMFIEDAL